MSFKNYYKSCGLGLALLFSALCAAARDGVAVVVDVVSYDKARAELNDYVKALEQKQGYKVYVVVDRWQVPDSIRAELMALHTQKHDAIVGAVLVGDIPVPMVRDAQYLTSAFKMDQTVNRRESSVPSDRFYDDFSLRFRPTSSAAAYAPPMLGARRATTSCVLICARPRPLSSIQSVLDRYLYLRATAAYQNRCQPTSTSFAG